MQLLEDHFCHLLLGKPRYYWIRLEKTKAGPKRTFNIVIKVKSYLNK